MVLASLALILQGVSWPVAPVAPAASRTPAAAALSPSGTAAPVPAERLRILVSLDLLGASKGFRIPDVVDQVREIWRPYIDIDFAEAGHGSVPRYDDRLSLVITDRVQARGSSNEAALGWIEFTAGRPENTITVSVAAARALMNRGRWLGRPFDELPLPYRQRFVTHALSRSAAHEIGHYLLRSSMHAPDGLMRERMTVDEIMDESLGLFQLGTSEVTLLERRRLRASTAEDAATHVEQGPASSC
jgi:hypothetical protein